eukprot:sb/3474206/
MTFKMPVTIVTNSVAMLTVLLTLKGAKKPPDGCATMLSGSDRRFESQFGCPSQCGRCRLSRQVSRERENESIKVCVRNSNPTPGSQIINAHHDFFEIFGGGGRLFCFQRNQSRNLGIKRRDYNLGALQRLYRCALPKEYN